MSEQNKAILRRWYESMSRDKPDFDLLAPDLVDHQLPPELQGREGAKASLGMFFKAFSSWHITAEDMIAEGDKVVARGTGSFKHTGEFQGIRATGKQVTIPFIAAWRVKNGKLAERWEQYDALGLMQQLGAIPPPGPAR